MYLTIFGGKYSINSLHLLNISLLEKIDIYKKNVTIGPRLLGLISKELSMGAY